MRTLKCLLKIPKDTLRRLLCEPSNFMYLCISSYLFPDGRTQNPDLTGLCEPSPQDHIKVTQVRATCFSCPECLAYSSCCFFYFTFYCKRHFLYSFWLDTPLRKDVINYCMTKMKQKAQLKRPTVTEER